MGRVVGVELSHGSRCLHPESMALPFGNAPIHNRRLRLSPENVENPFNDL